MKVAQEIDVDNVTIIINPQNKLEAKIPTSTPSEVVIEEINANLRFTFNQGLVVHRNDTNTDHPLQKLGRIKGTDWLAIRANYVFGDVQSLPISTDLSVECGEIYTMGDSFKVNQPPVVRITTNDMQGKIPQGVKFDVTVGNETRTYSYPYSVSNEYVWNNLTDFSYNTSTSVVFSNAVFVFADGQSTPSLVSHRCAFALGVD